MSLQRHSLLLSIACLLPVLIGLQNEGASQHAVAQDVAIAVNATVIVEGTVSRVYQADGESLVQLMVQKSELPNLADAARANYPAPGQYVYIHVLEDSGLLRRFDRQPTVDLPQAQATIRASLKLDKSGQWVPEGRDWFQFVSEGSAGQRPTDRPRSPLGLEAEKVVVGQETLLKVVSLSRNSPAATAGVEPGDLLVAANRIRLESQEQLEDLYRRSNRVMLLTVRDVRSGRQVNVNVDVVNAAPAERQGGNMQPLGVTAKLAFFAGKPVLEITGVEEGSAAERARLETGLLILEANGTEVSKPEELEAAVRDSRGRLELRVVDPKDRSEKNVLINLF